MPILEDNPAMKGASGTLGGALTYRRVGDRTIVAQKGKKREKLSAKQEVQVASFTKASSYAKRALMKPEMKALYERGIDKKKHITNAYTVAIQDFLKPPVIHEIDTKDYSGEAGQLIRVRASDNFKVKSVTVSVANAEGEMVETGEALERGKKGLWRYTTTIRRMIVKGSMITAVARDYADNATTQIFTML
ncbi:MAG: hypothetical protein QM762_21295 [Chryseolinea sp.]